MSTLPAQQVYIVQNEGICGGQPRIADTRLKVQHIAAEYEYLGWTPDQICDAHLEISLFEVHAAISYYYANKKEIDAAIQVDKDFAEKLRRQRA